MFRHITINRKIVFPSIYVSLFVHDSKSHEILLSNDRHMAVARKSISTHSVQCLGYLFIVVYLTGLPVAQYTWRRIVRWLLNNDWKIRERKRACHNLRYYPGTCLVGTEQNHRNPVKSDSPPSEIRTAELTNTSQQQFPIDRNLRLKTTLFYNYVFKQ
jgi:hypothetical protein